MIKTLKQNKKILPKHMRVVHIGSHFSLINTEQKTSIRITDAGVIFYDQGISKPVNRLFALEYAKENVPVLIPNLDELTNIKCVSIKLQKRKVKIPKLIDKAKRFKGDGFALFVLSKERIERIENIFQKSMVVLAEWNKLNIKTFEDGEVVDKKEFEYIPHKVVEEIKGSKYKGEFRHVLALSTPFANLMDDNSLSDHAVLALNRFGIS